MRSYDPPDCSARVLVIFDRSGSMNLPWETSDGEAPRWVVARDALALALEPLAASLTVGAILFPSGSSSELGMCAPVDPIEAQLDYRDGDAFLDAWDAFWSSAVVEGSTPIDIAFDRADAALPDDDVVTAVILLTDGAPTCEGPVPAWDHAADWRARGITTWVVGIPGAFGVAVLDRIALDGGSEASLDVGDPSALTSALRSILGEAVEQACL